jgi:hypothetical protein
MMQVHKVNTNTNTNTSAGISNIMFTGHSLGGCCVIMAMHAAMDFRKLVKVKCYTYASPMIGDRNFVKSLLELVPGTYNIVHKRDVIPRIPCFHVYAKHHGIIVIDNDSTFAFTEHIFQMMLMCVVGWSCCCSCFGASRYTGEALKGKAHSITSYIKVLEKIYLARCRKSSGAEYITRIYPILSYYVKDTGSNASRANSNASNAAIDTNMHTNTQAHAQAQAKHNTMTIANTNLNRVTNASTSYEHKKIFARDVK